jgi:two-component sensor histidine kinase
MLMLFARNKINLAATQSSPVSAKPVTTSTADDKSAPNHLSAKVILGMPRASIGFFMVAMVCAIALPMLAFVALLLAQLQINERSALESRTEREAQSLASGINRTLQEMSTTLKLLVTSPELDSGDLRAFHNRAQAALRAGSLFVILVDEDGQQLLNTRVPYGADLGKTSNLAALEAVLESGRVEVSDVFLGQTSGRWVFNVILPLPAELADKGAALILTKNADELATLMSTEGLPKEWSAAVLDSAGFVVAADDYPGISRENPFDASLLPRFSGHSGVVYDVLGATDNIVGYTRLFGWDWTAIVWGPVRTAQASILTTWQLLIFGGTALLAIALAAAIFLARQIRLSIQGIAEMAEEVGRGEMVSPRATQIRELDRVAEALSVASFDRSQAEDQIHLMLREMAHRTKNLLAVLQAMIHQTSRGSETVEDFQTAISQRIAGLGKSTDLLASKEWMGVPIRKLIDSHLSTFLESGDHLEISGENFQLKSEAVQNLGLVLHELSTNAVKYGALSRPEGRIRIAWEIHDKDGDAPRLVLTWCERGGPPVTAPKHKGFGTQIMERHAAWTFGGQVTIDYGTEGLFWTLDAPLRAFVEEPPALANAG